MTGYRAYKVLRDRVLRDELFAAAGAIVYDCRYHDYGCSGDDTRFLGEAHVSVTFDEAGDYPFFTIPARDLEDIGPAPFAKANP